MSDDGDDVQEIPELGDDLFDSTTEDQIERARREPTGGIDLPRDAAIARHFQAIIERSEREQGARAQMSEHASRLDPFADPDEAISLGDHESETVENSMVDEVMAEIEERMEEAGASNQSEVTLGGQGEREIQTEPTLAPCGRPELGSIPARQSQPQALRWMEKDPAMLRLPVDLRHHTIRTWQERDRQRRLERDREEWENELAEAQIACAKQDEERLEKRRAKFRKPQQEREQMWARRRRKQRQFRGEDVDENEASETEGRDAEEMESIGKSMGQSAKADGHNGRGRSKSSEQGTSSRRPSPRPVRWRDPDRVRKHPLDTDLRRIGTDYILSAEFIHDINEMLDMVVNWSVEAKAKEDRIRELVSQGAANSPGLLPSALPPSPPITPTNPPPSPRPKSLDFELTEEQQEAIRSVCAPPTPVPSPRSFQFMPTVTPDPGPTTPRYYVTTDRARWTCDDEYFGEYFPREKTQASHLIPRGWRLTAPAAWHCTEEGLVWGDEQELEEAERRQRYSDPFGLNAAIAKKEAVVPASVPMSRSTSSMEEVRRRVAMLGQNYQRILPAAARQEEPRGGTIDPRRISVTVHEVEDEDVKEAEEAESSEVPVTVRAADNKDEMEVEEAKIRAVSVTVQEVDDNDGEAAEEVSRTEATITVIDADDEEKGEDGGAEKMDEGEDGVEDEDVKMDDVLDTVQVEEGK
ncbi:hypothetical protein EK21DRAFT_108979 [Setomelanomma holmii]|uniref:Uncharacterized protein n=1 Tax=Setomelanomma holmii TaxID=210430 RepID=A0A9P4LQR7_9PLEO|nr:hypothetical protein EK21DRAFT_108979 [Setomelanomma holmii]